MQKSAEVENIPPTYDEPGYRHWIVDNKYHRVKAPAREWGDGYNISEEWYVDGKLHRTDGPAIVYKLTHNQWFVNNIEYTESQFKQLPWCKN